MLKLKISLLAMLCATTCCSAINFYTVEIPTLGGKYVIATDINNDNTIVGSSKNTEGDFHAFRYSLETGDIDDLGTLPDSRYSDLSGINREGMMIGSGMDQDHERAILIEPDHFNIKNLGLSEPINTKDSLFTPLKSLGLSINDAQEVCGMQIALSSSDQFIMRPMFYSSKTGMIDLNLPEDYVGGIALAINNRSWIVGSTNKTTFPSAQATLWIMKEQSNGKKEVQNITLLDGLAEKSPSRASAVNDLGQVVGNFTVNGLSHAFLWTEQDGIKDLGTLPGDTQARAQAINNNGIIAGISYGEGQSLPRAFVWKEGRGMIDLGISATDPWELEVTAINDMGVVLVLAGAEHAYAVDTKNLIDE